MSNLLDSLRSFITPDLISHISKSLGESEKDISKAMNSISSAILVGILSKEGDSTSMDSVMDLVSKSSSTTSDIQTNLERTLQQETSNISNYLTVLFGNKSDVVVDFIANQSGTKKSSVHSLFGIIIPNLLANLKRYDLSSSSWRNVLNLQKKEILTSAPRGFASLMGVPNEEDNKNSVTSQNTSTGYQNGQGFPKWIIPLLLILVALITLYYFTIDIEDVDQPLVFKQAQTIVSVEENSSPDVNSMLDSLSYVADHIASAKSETLGEFIKVELPNEVKLQVPSKGVENQIVNWLNDGDKVIDTTTWFNFDRLLFETGKSTLKSQSQEQLKNIAAILIAYPLFKIKLGGYTDNIGDNLSNLKLSEARAKVVMQELIKLGVQAKRLSAEGYGAAHPVASNDTEDGRSQNRRIAIRIIKN